MPVSLQFASPQYDAPHAIVSLGPKWCARQVDASYNDGTQITMNVLLRKVEGFMLPRF